MMRLAFEEEKLTHYNERINLSTHPQKTQGLEFMPSIKITCKLGSRRLYGTLHLGQRAGTDATVIKVYYSTLLQIDRGC